MNKVKSEPMPARAAAYLDVAHMRERIFVMMFERYGDTKKALEASHKACLFIEEGEVDDDTVAVKDVPDLSDSDLEALQAGVEGDPPSVDAATPEDGDVAELVQIGRKFYTREQIAKFEEMWRDQNIPVSQMVDLLNVSAVTVYNIASRLNLGSRGQKIVAARPSLASFATVSLEDALDWYEAQSEGKAIIPSKKYPGSYAIGDEEETTDSAIVTRNALIGEINALRKRKGENPFNINGI